MARAVNGLSAMGAVCAYFNALVTVHPIKVRAWTRTSTVHNLPFALTGLRVLTFTGTATGGGARPAARLEIRVGCLRPGRVQVH